jgi:hypothetical protein
LGSAFQTDVFNTARDTRDPDEQKALFLAQIEIVRPKAMLVMDMSSRPRKRGGGWHYNGPIQPLEKHLQADGFSLVVAPDFDLRAATATCEPPAGTRFSFEVYRIYHYVKLTDSRLDANPEAAWENRFNAALKMAQLTMKIAELEAALQKSPSIGKSTL